MAILHCSCTNTYMDKKYGKGQRVMNYSKKKDIYRCANCTKERSSGGDFLVRVIEKTK